MAQTSRDEFRVAEKEVSYTREVLQMVLCRGSGKLPGLIRGQAFEGIPPRTEGLVK